MKVSSTPGSAKYRYVPYAVRSLGGGSGIYLIMFACILGCQHNLQWHASTVYEMCGTALSFIFISGLSILLREV